MGVITETNAEKAIEELKAYEADVATALRDGRWTVLPAAGAYCRQLVRFSAHSAACVRIYLVCGCWKWEAVNSPAHSLPLHAHSADLVPADLMEVGWAAGISALAFADSNNPSICRRAGAGRPDRSGGGRQGARRRAGDAAAEHHAAH